MSNTADRRFRVVLLLCLVFPLLAGCSGVDDRQSVTGVVTVDGSPLELGVVSFLPRENTAAVSSGATVREGAFELPAERGLRPGRYTVQVLTYRETGRTVTDPHLGEQPELEELRFQESDLEAVVEEDGPNHFEFALTTVE